jgi:hypothetical protein
MRTNINQGFWWIVSSPQVLVKYTTIVVPLRAEESVLNIFALGDFFFTN